MDPLTRSVTLVFIADNVYFLPWRVLSRRLPQ